MRRILENSRTFLDSMGLPVSTYTIHSVMSQLTGVTSNAIAAWPSSNLAIFVPVVITKPFLAKKMHISNGAVSGNVDVGIYTPDGIRLVSSGSVAHSGVSTIQTIDIADTIITKGLYYLALAIDNTTSTITRQTAAQNIFMKSYGLAEQTSAFPLPATATFATVANNYNPTIAVSANVDVL